MNNPQEIAEELWDKYSEHIDDDISSLETVAGSSVIKRQQFIDSINDVISKERYNKVVDVLEEIMQNDPAKALKFMLLQLGKMCVDANVSEMNMTQNSTINDVRHEVRCDIKVRPV